MNRSLANVLFGGFGEIQETGSADDIYGGKVKATVVSHGRHKKIEILKFRRRKHHQKRTGHRQDYTEIEITDIKG